MRSNPPIFPCRVLCADTLVDLEPMRALDRRALVAFVATLPVDDLLFVARDLRHPKVIDAWMRALDAGRMQSLIARDAGNTVLGCTAIITDGLSWSRHVCELRVIISPVGRGKGVGRALLRACFAQALALGFTKLTAQMIANEGAAMALFEELGFRREALLRNHVRARDGRVRDLVLLSFDVEDSESAGRTVVDAQRGAIEAVS